jgi:hypothetical protein
MPSTKNSNKSLKIRYCENGIYRKRTKINHICVRQIHFGAYRLRRRCCVHAPAEKSALWRCCKHQTQDLGGHPASIKLSIVKIDRLVLEVAYCSTVKSHPQPVLLCLAPLSWGVRLKQNPHL